MKSKLLFSLALALILTIIPFNAAASASVSQDVDLAQKAAQNYIEEIAVISSEYSQWENARATNPQPYENLEGQVNVYMFEVTGNKGIVGHILVGSSLYCYDLLEAGVALPPTIPETSVVQKAVDSLGLTIDEAAINKPDRYVYTGVDGCYAVYTTKDQEVAINLVFGTATLVSDLKMSMTSPEDYLEGKKETSESNSKSTRSAVYDWLTMYYYSGGWCGPCSGVSIGAYYRDYVDYEDLYSSNADMYDDLYDEMDTGDLYPGMTLPGSYGPGFVAMTENCGYDNFSYANDWTVTHNDYWTVVSGIDSGHPTALCIIVIGGEWHWRAIRGYYYDVGDEYYRIFCTNSATHENMEILNWDALGDALFTCRIID